MKPAEWSRVCDLFAALRELPPEARPDAAAELEPDARLRETAVRLLDLHAAADDFLEAPVARVMFAYERRALAQVDHPAVARIIDGGTTGEGWPYMTMELVDGRPITRHCDEERLGPKARLRLFADVCPAWCTATSSRTTSWWTPRGCPGWWCATGRAAASAPPPAGASGAGSGAIPRRSPR